MTKHRKFPRLTAAPSLLALGLAITFAALPAQALYKVVGPDGKVTYTDRPAVQADGKVQPLSTGGKVSNDVALPFELRQTVQRFPVTLYTALSCLPCDSGRQLLRQRGVPFNEKSVSTFEDGEALQRIVGTRDLPALTIGGQILRGLQVTEWNNYLDSAGYPKESKLPANFPQGSATPLTDKKESVQAPVAPRGVTPPPARSAPEREAPPSPPGIRF